MVPDHATPLAAAFLAALADPARAESSGAPGELADALGEAWRAARLAWPDLDVPPEAFAAYLAARVPAASAPPAAAIRGLRAADLYFVCACVRRDPRALATFETRYAAEIERALDRLNVTPLVADDIKGRLRERLLFPAEGERSPLATYSGRGELGMWLRSITVRDFFKSQAPPGGAPLELEALNVAVPGGDPELSHLKATFAAEFKAAFARAFGALAPRGRNLLRQHLLDGLSVDDLGALYRVHRATAARWVARTRETLIENVRRELSASPHWNGDEFESLMRLARSQLDVSLTRLLQQGGAAARGDEEG